MTIILGIALVLVFGQAVQPDRQSKPQHGESIVVIGCVSGSTLVLRKADGSTTAPDDFRTTYRLRVSKDDMKTLRAHNGHEEEVTGTLRATDKTALGTKEIGKRGRVYVREEREFSGSEQLPEIEVTSLRHVSGTCAKNPR